MTVQIDINAKDNTKAAWDSAASTAQQAANQIKKSVADLGDIPGVKTAQASSAVLSQRMDAAIVRAQKLKQEMTLLGKATPVERWQEFSKGLNSAVKESVTGIAKFGAMAAAVGYATKKVYDFAKSGAEIDYTRQKFDRLALSVGDTGNVFLGNLRKATQGTVSDFGLLRQGSDLLQLGLAKDTQEAIRLSKVMTALGMDTGELTLALANQSKRRLDQLGLSLSMFNKIESKLKEQGYSKQDAFKEAFIQTAESTVAITGNRADSQFGNYLRLEAQLANTVDAAKKAIMGAPLVSDAANILQAMNAVRNQDMAWTGNLFELLTGEGPVLRQGMASDYSSLWANKGRGPRNTAVTGLSAAQNYTAMAYAYRYKGGQGLPESGEGATVDYEMLLDGALKITSQTEKYRDATAELNLQLSTQNTELARLTKKYGENSDKVKDQIAKIKQTRGQMSQMEQAQGMAGGGMVLSNLSGMGADPQLMLDYARAAGLVTQEAYNAQSAYLKVADALNTGKNTAMEAAVATKAISSGLGRLDGARYTAYVDVIVNWIGSVGVFGGANGLNRKNQAAVQVCFVAGTLILMDGMTYKPIEDVQTGDRVISYDFKQDKFVPAVVGETYYHKADEMGEYYLLVNDSIGVTPNHPLYINGSWQNAEVLKFGDVLTTLEGTIPVLSVEKVYEQVETYNLHINDENHNYFAGGILAHNKAGGGWISAPGDGSVDTILVPLANNEFVVNAKSAKRYKTLLEAMNEGRLGSGMAAGGRIGFGGASGGSKLPTFTSPPSWMNNIGNRGGRNRGGSGDALGGGVVTAADAVSVNNILAAAQTGGGIAPSMGGGGRQSTAQLERIAEGIEILIGKTATASDIGRAVHSKGMLQA